MGTFNAFYIRSASENAIITNIINKNFCVTRLDYGNGFYAATLPAEAYEPPKLELSNLSLQFKTDVFWVGFQSAVDAFQFYHWNSGKCLRTLVFGCYQEERTWEQADGTPEPWERAAFFPARTLEFALEDAPTDSDKRELERIWREAELTPGRSEPNIDAKSSAWAVATHYQFPGWG